MMYRTNIRYPSLRHIDNVDACLLQRGIIEHVVTNTMAATRTLLSLPLVALRHILDQASVAHMTHIGDCSSITL